MRLVPWLAAAAALALASCTNYFHDGDGATASRECEMHGGVRWVETTSTARVSNFNYQSWYRLTIGCRDGTEHRVARSWQ